MRIYEGMVLRDELLNAESQASRLSLCLVSEYLKDKLDDLFRIKTLHSLPVVATLNHLYIE